MKKVLVALRMERSSGQRKLSGIYCSLSERGGWQIQLVESSYELTANTLQKAIDNGTDGIILSLQNSEDVLRPLAHTSIPTVVMDVYSPALSERRTNIAFINNSAKAIAKAAFDHFFNQGRFVSYVYVPAKENERWSLDRGDCFARLTATHGIVCNMYSGDIGLTDYLRALPPPVAVFAATDIRASEVLQAARIARLPVPRRIAVIGVDDNELICENAIPRLSSIRPAFDEEGFRAAEVLDRMMNRLAPNRSKQANANVMFIETAAVTPRESTAVQTASGRLVDRTVSYIRENATKGIGVDDVVQKMRVSRRLLYLRFAEQRGESIQQLINRCRLDEARRLLVTTSLSTSEICVRCGFSCENVLRNLFKRAEHMSMGAFRKLHSAK